MARPYFKCLSLGILASFFVGTIAVAQDAINDFGVFSYDETSFKQCEFDKTADAVILLDRAVSMYSDEYNLITERRIRIKILKETGIARADIHIPYYAEDQFEFLYDVQAIVMNQDEQNKQVINRLERKNIYKKELNKYYSELSFALPNVKVGSIIEYKYKSQMKHYGGLREWVFQHEIPVVLSSYNLTIVPNAEFAYSVYKNKFLDIKVVPNRSSGSVLFEMKNIPGLRDEPFMRARRDYLQRVAFQFSGYNTVRGASYATSSSTKVKHSTTWKDLASELVAEKGFGGVLNKAVPGTEEIKLLSDAESTPYGKMNAIYNYVRNKINWNNIYSKYASDGLKNTWENKTGTSGEINLLLINLLKSVDLDVYPMLTCDRNYGHIDSTYPFLDQFNTVAACVVINNKQYILDAKDKFTPAFLTPHNLLNTTGFIVDRKNYALINMVEPIRKSLSVINLTGVIEESGVVNLKASVKDYDYARIDKKKAYLNDKSSYRKSFFDQYNSAEIDTFFVDGIENDSLPMTHNVGIKVPLNKTGDYLMANYNYFTGLTKNPFINEFRFSDIDFGSAQQYVLNGSFEVPQNLAVESIPKNFKMVNPDKSIEMIRQVTQVGNSIRIGVLIEIRATAFSTDYYSELQSFYKEMLDVLNEPILLKAKS